MTAGPARQGTTWTARFAWALLLLAAGAALATWGLSRWETGLVSSGWRRNSRCRSSARLRRFLRIRSEADPWPRRTPPGSPPSTRPARRSRAGPGRAGSAGGPTPCWSPSPRAGRSIAAWRSATSSRCWSSASARCTKAAVATIVTASRDPVSLDSLIADYQAIGPQLRGGGPEEGWWDGFRRELGSIVTFHRADMPSPQPQARYDRAWPASRRAR